MDYDKLTDYQHILLRQAYSQKLEQNDKDIKTWTQYRDRHKKIIEGLQTLVLDLTVNCMVPIGKRALMKGKLSHTNEILVCIGDGYFVKYSAHQAIALCNRRIKNAEEMLKKFEQERNLFEVRQMLPLEFGAFESGDCKDVIEYWDDKKLEEWRVEHRKKEKEYQQKLIELKRHKKKEIVTEDDLFERLDQLELEEELADEINRLEEQHDHLYGQFVQDGAVDQESDEEDTEGEEEEEEGEEGEEEETTEETTEEKGKTINLVQKSENEKTCTLNKQETNASIVEEIKCDKKIQIQKQDQESITKTTHIEQKTELLQKSNKENIVTKDTKINGKFEVSIIREDEVEKVLGRSSSSLNPDTNANHYKSSPNKERKTKKGIRTTLLNDIMDAEFDSQCEKFKSSGRRVSFAEPHFTEMKSNSDQGEDFEGDTTNDETKCAQDATTTNNDLIKIEFNHSKKPTIISEGKENDIISPHDIYRIFCKPKSILKRSPNNKNTQKNVPTVNCNFQENTIEESSSTSTYNLVVQDIQERKIEQATEVTEITTNKRPISRFKLERANLKK